MVSEPDTNNFTYTAGDYIKTDVAWNPPSIKNFCKFANEHLVGAFPQHDIFLHGAFPHLPTWDVDIAVIGEPTDDAGKTSEEEAAWGKNKEQVVKEKSSMEQEENMDQEEHIESEHCIGQANHEQMKKWKRTVLETPEAS